ncbi:hypothetical protein OG909_09520 [Streptomyces sp. NBC_01754]|uniref:hypothetical protein n=1 Tax=Streptomyces sp. NBC_01754 TaxID=2975930 RepID=UPI002DD8DE67|nr:hypothetical protein [Streptomyces sp. NBC_01754]WSC92513.1 hypothetical protein OG909_09520 [Streptomyces sp. NBC_01754]
MFGDEQAEPLVEIGSVKRDAETGRVGVVQRTHDGAVRLQAVSSDERWEVDPEQLRDLTSIELLSARTALANYYSRNRV